MKIEEANKLTVEQALNFACSKIVEQGSRCMAGDTCIYGDGEGKHCAVGWLLDEDNPDLMNRLNCVVTLVDEVPELMPEAIKANSELFFGLQSFHDSPTQKARTIELEYLREETGLSLDEPHWEQWVQMGEVEDEVVVGGE